MRRLVSVDQKADTCRIAIVGEDPSDPSEMASEGAVRTPEQLPDGSAKRGPDQLTRVEPTAFSDLALIRIQIALVSQWPVGSETQPLAPERPLLEYLTRTPVRELINQEIEAQVVSLIPGRAFLAGPLEIREGSIELLVLIGTALSVVKHYNEIVETLDSAAQNTRRIVERVADRAPIAMFTALVTASWVPGPRLAGLDGEQLSASHTRAFDGQGLAILVGASLLLVTYLVGLFIAAKYVLSLID